MIGEGFGDLTKKETKSKSKERQKKRKVFLGSTGLLYYYN